MNARLLALTGTLVGLLCGLAGCKDSHEHEHDHAKPEGHVHTAPHGGTLVELGEHAFNIEFTRDVGKGLVTAYLLDAHAENFVRLTQPSLGIQIHVNGKPESFTLAAVANDRTGEKVGDTSQFEAQSEAFKVTSELKGIVPSLELRGSKFESIPFVLPAIGK